MKGNSGWNLGGLGGGGVVGGGVGGGSSSSSSSTSGSKNNHRPANETDRLLGSSASPAVGAAGGSASSTSSYVQSRLSNNPEIRERRPSNRSNEIKTMESSVLPEGVGSAAGALHQAATGYTRILDDNGSNRSGGRSVQHHDDHSASVASASAASSYQNSAASRSLHSIRRSYVIEKTNANNGNARERGSAAVLRPDEQPPHHYLHQQQDQQQQPPLLEIPEEIYGVRKAALRVLKPLTRTWLIISVGFALTILFGMARWTRLLPKLPFWFILLPSWVSHLGLFGCHVTSARALSSFIAEANESRQRPDSRDHLDRTEYLPLLQRSLKFGLKTGLISFGVFLFEILIYFRLARGRPSLTVCLFPIWLMVLGGVVDGIICRTQHLLRVCCWLLVFATMVLLCLKVDYGYNSIRWMMIVSPIVAVLSVASASLIYIVYGHQVGYYRLTESQLTAGNLYSLAALISIVLVVVIGEVIPLARPVEIETRVFVVLMAPLVVVLLGMGAWVVSRDEFGRLLLYGGQAQVFPRKLRWEAGGWTSVQGRGVTTIPLFGEVRFRPLEQKPDSKVELCMCCTCYPYEDNEDDAALSSDHPYLAPVPSTLAPAPFAQHQHATQTV